MISSQPKDKKPSSEEINKSKPGDQDDFKSLPMKELEAKLKTSPEGLSQAEAHKRLLHY